MYKDMESGRKVGILCKHITWIQKLIHLKYCTVCQYLSKYKINSKKVLRIMLNNLEPLVLKKVDVTYKTLTDCCCLSVANRLHSYTVVSIHKHQC